MTVMPQVAEAINFMHRAATDRQIETNQIIEQRFTDLNTTMQANLERFLPQVQQTVFTTMQNVHFNVNVNTTIDPGPPILNIASAERNPDPVNADTITNATVVPTYQMSRSITTVQQLWKEWNVGFEGQRSVKELERLFGHAWRNGSKSSESKFYNGRKILLQEVESLISSGRSVSAAIDVVEDRRVRCGKRGKAGTLNQLIQSIRTAQEET